MHFGTDQVSDSDSTSNIVLTVSHLDKFGLDLRIVYSRIRNLTCFGRENKKVTVSIDAVTPPNPYLVANRSTTKT